MEGPHDLRHAGGHGSVTPGNGHAEAPPDVRLNAHNLFQTGERPAGRVMGQHEVDTLPLLAEPVGQDDLPDLEIDAHEDAAHVSLRIAV